MNKDRKNRSPVTARAAGRGGTGAECVDNDEGGRESDSRHDLTLALAHELRNAAAPIRNAVQLIRIRGTSDPGLAAIADMIDRQVDEIVRIVNALGDAKRLPSTGLTLEAEKLNDSSPAVLGMATSKEALTGKPIPPLGQAAKRILIADDNAALRTSLASILQDMGHEVRTTVDGAQALELAQHWRPEVVLLDINMPRLNGFEVAKKLRMKFPSDVMRLVMMSGTALNEMTLRGAMRAGFDDCIDKVNDVDALRKLLEGKN